MAIFEFAGGLSRLGHDVQLVHRWHPFADDRVATVEDISWFKFDERIRHHFAEKLDEFPPADFIFWPPSAAYLRSESGPNLPPALGLPVMLVQGDLTGTAKLLRRMGAPFPKVCIAHWLVDFGLQARVPEHQLVHVPYGIRHDVYRLTAPIEDRPMQVAMLYQVHPKKGVRYGLESLTEVKRRLPELRCVLFGTRDPKEPMPPWITYLKSPEREVLVRDVYNRSRVFVQPSIREGFGFTAVEAMAGGCALVTTSNGGSDDYAVPDFTALVTQPQDVDAMSDCIEQLLRDDQTRIRIAVRGNEYVKRFDWAMSARRLETFLTQYGSDPIRFQQPSSEAG
jgi:glycosyltransferase involved in cell wall biosynthesis